MENELGYATSESELNDIRQQVGKLFMTEAGNLYLFDAIENDLCRVERVGYQYRQDGIIGSAILSTYEPFYWNIMSLRRSFFIDKLPKKRITVSVNKSKLYRFLVEMPCSEVCLHMRVAGKPMMVELLSRSAQLYDPLTGRPFSSPILFGEAGVYPQWEKDSRLKFDKIVRFQMEVYDPFPKEDKESQDQNPTMSSPQ